MKLLDWYILKRYISHFFYAVFLFVLVIVAIDYTEKNDDFITKNLSFKQVFSEYYLNFVPYLANLLSPIFIFVSTIFVTSRMAAHTEIVAILASGVSFKRVLWTFFVGSVFVAALIFLVQMYLLPKANEKRVEFELTYLEDSHYSVGQRHFVLGNDTYAYVQDYVVDHNRGNWFTIEKFDGRRLVSKIYSNQITWDSAKSKWHLDRYMIRTINDDGSDRIAFGNGMDTTLNLKKSDFERKYKTREVLTTPELSRVIKEIKSRRNEKLEPYLVEYHARFAYPVAVIILTLMAVIVSARKSREGPGVKIAIGLLLAFVFIGMIYVMRLNAESGDISPFLSAWLPMFIFAAVTVFLYRTVPK